MIWKGGDSIVQTDPAPSHSREALSGTRSPHDGVTLPTSSIEGWGLLLSNVKIDSNHPGLVSRRRYTIA